MLNTAEILVLLFRINLEDVLKKIVNLWLNNLNKYKFKYIYSNI